MNYYGRSREQSCDDLRYEKERLEAENEKFRQQEEDTERQRERDRKERQQEARDRQHSAQTWDEAFRKGLCLYRKEADEERRDNERYKDDPAWRATSAPRCRTSPAGSGAVRRRKT